MGVILRSVPLRTKHNVVIGVTTTKLWPLVSTLWLCDFGREIFLQNFWAKNLSLQLARALRRKMLPSAESTSSTRLIKGTKLFYCLYKIHTKKYKEPVKV